MKYNKSKGNDYIQQYPKVKKWINTCICCGQSGYKPDLPDTLINKWGNKTMRADYSYLIWMEHYSAVIRAFHKGRCKPCKNAGREVS